MDAVTAPPLRSRVARAGAWSLGLRGASRVLTVVRTIVLARLLAPDDFGLFGIALLVLSVLETFFQPGLHQALVRMRGDVGRYLDVVWTVQVARGAAVAGAVFLAAPLLAAYFAEPAVVSIVRVIGVAIAVRSLASVGVVLLQRELAFERRTRIVLAETAVDLLVTVAAAFLLRDVRALAIGILAGKLAYVLATYAVHPYRPRLAWDPAALREIRKEGAWLAGANVSTFVAVHAPGVVIGRLLGAPALGVYQMAHRLANAVALELGGVVQPVAFPAFAALQGERARLRSGFLQLLKLACLVAFPAAVLVAVAAPVAVPLLLGPAWGGTAAVVQVLAVWGAMHAVDAACVPVLRAVGRGGVVLWTYVVQALLAGALMLVLAPGGGVVGAAVAAVAASAVCTAARLLVASRQVGVGPGQVARVVGFPAVAAALMLAAMVGAAALVPPGWELAAETVVGAAAYAGAVLAFERWFGFAVRAWLVERLLATRTAGEAR